MKAESSAVGSGMLKDASRWYMLLLQPRLTDVCCDYSSLALRVLRQLVSSHNVSACVHSWQRKAVDAAICSQVSGYPSVKPQRAINVLCRLQLLAV